MSKGEKVRLVAADQIIRFATRRDGQPIIVVRVRGNIDQWQRLHHNGHLPHVVASGKIYTAQIRPARIQIRDKKGQLTEETIEYYPSSREELIEHALRKFASEQCAGFFDRENYRSGVAFTLSIQKQLLEVLKRGHEIKRKHTETRQALKALLPSMLEQIFGNHH